MAAAMIYDPTLLFRWLERVHLEDASANVMRDLGRNADTKRQATAGILCE
jgi:hypothetical protein